MTVPHRDDVAGLATLRPNHHYQPAVEMTRTDEAGLAVIEPLIGDCRGAAGKDFAGAREIQAAMPQCQIAFGRVKGDLQLIVPPINVKQP
jgi:hypothetical protein